MRLLDTAGDLRGVPERVTRMTTRRDPLDLLRARGQEHGWGAVDQMHTYGTVLRARRLVLGAADVALAHVGLTSSRHT